MEAFLNHLSEIKDDYRWHIRTMDFANVPLYLIRGSSDNTYLDMCPLCAVGRNITGVPFTGMQHKQAGAAIGLSPYDCKEIAYASDTLMDWKLDVRQAILEALKLEEHKGCPRYYSLGMRPLASR